MAKSGIHICASLRAL